MAQTFSGGVPGGAPENWANILAAGILGNTNYKQRQQDRQDKADELDLKRQQLEADKQSNKLLRQAQLWQSVQAGGQHAGQEAYQRIIASGGSEQEAQLAADKSTKQYITGVIGNDTDTITDTYGPQAVQYATSIAKNGDKVNTNTKGITYTPQMFANNPYQGNPQGIGPMAQNMAALAGIHPGRTYSPSPNVQDPILGPMFSGPSPYGNAGGNNRMPSNIDPQMAALMSIMAMHNGIGAPPQMPANNPYTQNGTVPLGPVSLSQGQ